MKEREESGLGVVELAELSSCKQDDTQTYSGHPYKQSSTSVSMPTAHLSPLPALFYNQTHTFSEVAAVATRADDEWVCQTSGHKDAHMSSPRSSRKRLSRQLLSYLCAEI